jgi:hypothetical protein
MIIPPVTSRVKPISSTWEEFLAERAFGQPTIIPPYSQSGRVSAGF